MKPRRQDNYGVSARLSALERDGNLKLWGGAYWLQLNDAVTVQFVPELPSLVEELRCPDDIDMPANRAEALAILALAARYVITPNDTRAGTAVKLNPTADNNESDAAIFFVTQAEYAQAVRELRRIHKITAGASPSAHYRNEFADGEVIRLVESRIFTSPFLGNYARSILPVSAGPTEVS